MINVRHLGVFRAVMKTGSVSGAARLLSVSQPSVTKTLQQIEWEIGVPLFQRVKGRLRATAESDMLLPRVDRIFTTLDDIETFAQTLRKVKVGQVSFAAATTLAASVGIAAIEVFRKGHPDVGIKVKALPTRNVVEEVANNQVDFGLCDSVSTGGSLRSEEICRGFIGCVVRRDHRLAGKTVVTLSDLGSDPLISFLEETLVGAQLRRLLAAATPALEISFATNQSMIACRLVDAGCGVGLIDPFTVTPDMFPKLVVKRLHPDLEIRPRLVFPPDRPLSLAATEFLAQVRRSFAERISEEESLEPL